MAKLFLTNASRQFHDVGYRDVCGKLLFERIAPGQTAQVGAGLDLAALEQTATRLHEVYGAVPVGALPLLPNHSGLAREIET